MSVEEFEATDIDDTRGWRFSDPHLTRLVELVDEHGTDIYQLDDREVIGYVFDGKAVDVDTDPTHDLSVAELQFVDRFVEATPVTKTGSVGALYDSDDAFAETVDRQLSESSDPEQIKNAIEWKAKQ